MIRNKTDNHYSEEIDQLFNDIVISLVRKDNIMQELISNIKKQIQAKESIRENCILLDSPTKRRKSNIVTPLMADLDDRILLRSIEAKKNSIDKKPSFGGGSTKMKPNWLLSSGNNSMQSIKRGAKRTISNTMLLQVSRTPQLLSTIDKKTNPIYQFYAGTITDNNKIFNENDEKKPSGNAYDCYKSEEFALNSKFLDHHDSPYSIGSREFAKTDKINEIVNKTPESSTSKKHYENEITGILKKPFGRSNTQNLPPIIIKQFSNDDSKSTVSDTSKILRKVHVSINHNIPDYDVFEHIPQMDVLDLKIQTSNKFSNSPKFSNTSFFSEKMCPSTPGKSNNNRSEQDEDYNEDYKIEKSSSPNEMTKRGSNVSLIGKNNKKPSLFRSGEANFSPLKYPRKESKVRSQIFGSKDQDDPRSSDSDSKNDEEVPEICEALDEEIKSKSKADIKKWEKTLDADNFHVENDDNDVEVTEEKLRKCKSKKNSLFTHEDGNSSIDGDDEDDFLYSDESFVDSYISENSDLNELIEIYQQDFNNKSSFRSEMISSGNENLFSFNDYQQHIKFEVMEDIKCGEDTDNETKITDYQYLMNIAKGGYGRVDLYRKKNTKDLHAIKTVSISFIVT